MGSWLIAIALVIVVILIAKSTDIFLSYDLSTGLIAICVTAAIVFFLLGIFATPAGYEEPELVREVKLVSSSDASELNYQGPESYVAKELYSISKTAGNRYKYIIYYELPSSPVDNSIKVYTREEIIAYNSDVTIIESSSQVAIMREYITRPKKSFWAFGAGMTTREYIFNIPKNTLVLVETAAY